MIELRVEGMTCGHCVSAVTRAVKAVDPQANVQVDLGAGRVRVDSRSSADALGKAIAEAGYPASAAGEQAPAAAQKKGGCCAA
ncbi:MAG: heavy-metal-associated domain-containing protein [Betaproteobacteria bacterium]|nr:heavy-metal-associated domain-containing protein [Betaproteobacteria bacterium]MDH5578099.1 heavy-metal-associated domain-containing protein [Betaproteobacteria bacterium]